MINNKPKKPEAIEKEFIEKVIQVKRVSKKTKGGNQISFSALVTVGNHHGKAGIGFAKAPDVVSSIQKALAKAKEHMVKIEIVNGTIAHEIYYKLGAAKIILRPAPVGTGVIAGGPIRAVVEAFGIQNLVSKRLGTSNKSANIFATFEALEKIKPNTKKPEEN